MAQRILLFLTDTALVAAFLVALDVLIYGSQTRAGLLPDLLLGAAVAGLWRVGAFVWHTHLSWRLGRALRGWAGLS